LITIEALYVLLLFESRNTRAVRMGNLGHRITARSRLSRLAEEGLFTRRRLGITRIGALGSDQRIFALGGRMTADEGNSP